MVKGFNIFYHDGTDWHLINAQYLMYTEPQDAINTATEVSVTIPGNQYATMAGLGGYAATKTWLGSNQAKYLCYTEPGVAAATLNAAFDTTIKFFYGRITSITQLSDHVVIKAKQMIARWLGEPIAAKDNVVASEGGVVSATSTTTVTVASPTWDTNEHANRGIRITARDGQTQHAHPASITATVVGSPSNESTEDDRDLAHAIDDDTGTDWVYAKTSSDTTFYIYAVADFTIPKCPGSMRLRAYVSCTAANGGDLYIYNWHTAAYVLLSEIAAGFNDLSITISNEECQYYNPATTTVRLKMISDTLESAGPHYGSGVNFYELYIDYSDVFNHPIIEYQIASNTDAEVATLASGNPETDHVNIGDKVQILYDENEWLESAVFGLEQSKYDDKINSITFVPTTIKPTYSEFDFMAIGQYMNDVTRRNNAFFYPSRKTTSGKYDIVVRAKNAPLDNGLAATPANIDGEDVDINFNRWDKVRAVIVKNKTTHAGFSSAGAYPANALPANDLPIVVLNCPTLPDAYLDDYAEQVYNARNALSDDIVVPLRTVGITVTTPGTEDSYMVDDFESWGLGATIDGAVPAGGGTWSGGHANLVCTVVAGQLGQFVSSGAAEYTKTLTFADLTHDPGAGDWFHFHIKCSVTDHNWNSYFGKDWSNFASFNCVSGHFYLYDGGWIDLQAYIAGTTYAVTINILSSTTYTVTIDATTYTNGGHGHYHTQAGNFNDFSWWFMDWASGNHGTVTLDDISTSWVQVEGEEGESTTTTYNVRDCADDKLHVGAKIHLHAAATTKNGTDYQLDGDYPIRNITWTKDEKAICALGHAESVENSPEQMLGNILSRHDNATTG